MQAKDSYMSPMGLDTLPPINHRIKLRPLNANTEKREEKKSARYLASLLQQRQREIALLRKATIGTKIRDFGADSDHMWKIRKGVACVGSDGRKGRNQRTSVRAE